MLKKVCICFIFLAYSKKRTHNKNSVFNSVSPCAKNNFSQKKQAPIGTCFFDVGKNA